MRLRVGMNTWLLSIVGAIYLWVGLGYWREGRHGMALAFFAYALANLGFVLDGLSAYKETSPSP